MAQPAAGLGSKNAPTSRRTLNNVEVRIQILQARPAMLVFLRGPPKSSICPPRSRRRSHRICLPLVLTAAVPPSYICHHSIPLCPYLPLWTRVQLPVRLIRPLRAARHHHHLVMTPRRKIGGTNPLNPGEYRRIPMNAGALESIQNASLSEHDISASHSFFFRQKFWIC